MGEWRTRIDQAAWRMERDGRGWAMNLDGFEWEEPAGLALRETERRFLDWERRRVIYVAATRARDLLVVPSAHGAQPGKHVCADLLAGVDPRLIREMDPYLAGVGAPWSRAVRAPLEETPADADTLEREVSARWDTAATEAARPRFKPASVSEEAVLSLSEEEEGPSRPPARKPRPGRFGPIFGTVVHEAIGLVLRDPALGAAAAVRKAGERFGLVEHFEEAVADVTRALEALRAEGLFRCPGPELQLEYPVAGTSDKGLLLGGYIDLIAVTQGQITVLDFKTDAPPAERVENVYPEYAAQVSTYASLVEAAGVAPPGQVRCALLFAADGKLRWLSREMPRSMTRAK